MLGHTVKSCMTVIETDGALSVQIYFRMKGSWPCMVSFYFLFCFILTGKLIRREKVWQYFKEQV